MARDLRSACRLREVSGRASKCASPSADGQRVWCGVKRHADFLGILYLAWGAIFALVGLAGLALAGGALAIARGGGPVSVNSEFAAGLTALTLGLIAMLALLFGSLHLWIGAMLRRYRPWARLLALALAVINLVLFPFGTALAGYALWVLLTEEGRALYLDAAADAVPS
jgi:hypothetical protein